MISLLFFDIYHTYSAWKIVMFSHAKLNYYLVKRQIAAWIMGSYRGATAPEKKSNEKQAKYDDQGVNEPGGLDSFFLVWMISGWEVMDARHVNNRHIPSSRQVLFIQLSFLSFCQLPPPTSPRYISYLPYNNPILWKSMWGYQIMW